METLQHQIKYHKVINIDEATRLFNEVVEEYVTQLIMPNGQVWVKDNNQIRLMM